MKIFIKTYGCSFNHVDSEIMAGILFKQGHSIVNVQDEADLVIINSCSVKNGSESKLFNDINFFNENNIKFVVAGCVPQAEPGYLNTKLKNCSVIGTNNLSEIIFAVNDVLNGKIFQKLNLDINRRLNEVERLERESKRLNIDKKRENKFVEIIPINEGCLNNCSFCKTKFARGNLFSYSIENIKNTMKKALDEGVYEIWLTSQDTACYGFDLGTNLPNLLKELLTLNGDYRIRIGMGNPNHFKKIIDEVLEIMLSDNRIYKFLHIPIQSGCNRILDEMRRMYTVEDYIGIISKIKFKIPNLTIANDIIVAYPTETFEEFRKTLEILKFSNVLNFSRFWLRPGTFVVKKYSKFDFIDGGESKKRIKEIKGKFEELALKNNSNWIGWEGEAFIVNIGKDKTESFILRNDYYKPIIVKIKKGLKVGDKVRVRITKVTWFDFRGEVI